MIRHDGTIDGELAARTPRIQTDGRTFAYRPASGRATAARRCRITQNDVRAIQLAKAALYAGVRLLMERLGVDRVDRIRLAGAFGSHIDVKYAMVLGMIPDCALDKVSSAGNAAGTGARIALLDQRTRATDRSARAPHREDRNRGRAAVPGILRRGDGHSAPDRAVSATARRGAVARDQGGHRRSGAPRSPDRRTRALGRAESLRRNPGPVVAPLRRRKRP